MIVMVLLVLQNDKKNINDNKFRIASPRVTSVFHTLENGITDLNITIT